MPASYLAKVTLWRIEARLYTLLDHKTWDLGEQLPGDYYGAKGPMKMTVQSQQDLRQAAWERFRDMDLFFVKVSCVVWRKVDEAYPK